MGTEAAQHVAKFWMTLTFMNASSPEFENKNKLLSILLCHALDSNYNLYSHLNFVSL